jgi:hypothetical protein
MKNFNLKILIALCVASVYFVGCGLWDEGAECRKLNCNANSYCLEGLCICKEGYQGDRCDTLQIQKFLGHWKGQEIYYHDSDSDTIFVDWTITPIPNSIKALKLTNINGKSVNMTLRNFEELYPHYDLSTQNETTFDSLHIATLGNATINKAKNKINYQFDYKQIGASPAFYGKGVLVKQ